MTHYPAEVRCSHPRCRTTTFWPPIECPHGRPFCEACVWEEGCSDCGDAVVPDLFAALDAAVAEAREMRPRAPRQQPERRVEAPDLSQGDVLASRNDAVRQCSACGGAIHVGQKVVTHWPHPGVSSVASYYHPDCTGDLT